MKAITAIHASGKTAGHAITLPITSDHAPAERKRSRFTVQLSWTVNVNRSAATKIINHIIKIIGSCVTATARLFKLYRIHGCDRQHRTYLSLARCMFKRAEWVIGEGPYASLAWCSVLTVALYADPTDALAAKQQIDDTGCGGRCYRRHEIVQLDLGSTAWTCG